MRRRLRRRPGAAPNSPRTVTVAPTAGSATLTRADDPRVDRLRPSPNFGDRRGRSIDALILHYTGMKTGEAALQRLLDPASEVSAHYLVWEDGRIDQLVSEEDRAWHAGASFWHGERDMNSVSIGIEIVNGGHDYGLPPYPDAQTGAVRDLTAGICRRRAIPPRRVLGHSDIAPARKQDPGERFPWLILARAGLVETIERSAPVTGGDPSPSRDALARLGYDTNEADLRDALAAFQRRWRQSRINGMADVETTALLEALLALREA